jgi:hypothetical protein
MGRGVDGVRRKGAATCGQPSANGGAWAALRDRCASGTWHRPGGPHASHIETRARRSIHRSQARLGVRVRLLRQQPTWVFGATSRTLTLLRVPAPRSLGVALFDRAFLKFVPQKWSKVSIPKL